MVTPLTPRPPLAGADDRLRRSLLGGIVGNVLEWYDFAVFAYFAPVIATQFFPPSGPTMSLLSTFAIFAGAYFMRPLGGILFGTIGDRLGRKHALQLSVLMMAVPTTAMAVLPTYEQIGWAAPVLLTVCRLVQGLSVGGELVGSMSYVIEVAPAKSRGLFGSIVVCSSTAGVMIGSGVAALAGRLDPASLAAWGWRLPFAAGLLIGGLGYWMRNGLEESPSFRHLQQTGQLAARPVSEAARLHGGRICQIANLVILSSAGFYILFVWWPTFLSEMIDPPIQNALWLNTISMLVLGALTPVAGWLSDLFGRRAVLMTSIGGVGLLAVPLFGIAARGNPSAALAAQLVFAALMAGVSAPLPATVMEMLPVRYRFSGAALGYNLSVAFFGGTAPFMATLLVSRTGSTVAPALYLMCLAGVSLLAASAVHRYAPQPANMVPAT